MVDSLLCFLKKETELRKYPRKAQCSCHNENTRTPRKLTTQTVLRVVVAVIMAHREREGKMLRWIWPELWLQIVRFLYSKQIKGRKDEWGVLLLAVSSDVALDGVAVWLSLSDLHGAQKQCRAGPKKIVCSATKGRNGATVFPAETVAPYLSWNVSFCWSLCRVALMVNYYRVTTELALRMVITRVFRFEYDEF